MKQLFFSLLLITSVFVITKCFTNQPPISSDVEVLPETESEEEEDQDGIKESMEMEFEMTRDIKLGYAPTTRLVNAYNKIMQERRAGRYARISALSWTERGPNTNSVGASNGNTRGPGNNSVTSGRIRTIWVDLADATNRTVWVGSVSGGLWKTNDISANPANWILINDFLGNLAVTSICQSPVNPDVMYFATGERNGNIDAVRGGGIWKSIDHGVTWNLLTNTIGFWNVAKIACDAVGNIYVGTNGNGAGVQRSTDGGTTWTNITPGPTTRVSDLRISSTGRMHVTMMGGTASDPGSYYTDLPATVTTGTWTSPTTPIPNLTNNCELAVAGNTLYALPANGSGLTPQVYKSVDGGAIWQATTTTPPSNSTSGTSINTGQGWYDLALGVDPSNPDVVVAGGLNFYRSGNGGGSWSQITQWVGTTMNYVHADHHGVVWNGTQVLVATDGGIFYSTDNGATYTDRNVGLRTKQFYSCAIHPTSLNYFLGGTQDNGTHQINNAGLSASVEVLGGDGGFVHIDEDEPQYQFGAITRSNFRRSINSGLSWSGINFSSDSKIPFINPSDYDDVNNRFYCADTARRFVRWDNPQTGSSFTPIFINTATTSTVMSVKVSPYTNNRVIFGSSGGRIVRVDEAHLAAPAVTNITGTGMPGSTVSSVNVGTTDNFLIATFSNYGAQHIWMSNSGGGSGGWTNISGNIPDIPVRWAMFYPEDNDKAIIATDMGIFETNDINGSSTVWVQNGSFPNVKTNMLQYRYTDNTILAATHGRGLWTTVFTPAAPYVRFASSYTYGRTNTEATVSTEGCRSYKDYTLNMQIDAPPTGDAMVTLGIASGTATEGVDYDFTTNGSFSSPSKQLQFASGVSSGKSITVRVYNDAELELAESFTLNYTVTGATNAVGAPSSLTYTFNIGDNDAAPVAETPTAITIGNGSYGSYIQPFRGSFAKAKSHYIYTAAELTAAGVLPGTISALGFTVTSKGSTAPYTGFNISLKNTTASVVPNVFETGAALCYSADYSTTTGLNNLSFNISSFTWDGVSNLLVEICYDNSAASGDDQVASNIVTDVKGAWARDQAGTGCAFTSITHAGVGNPPVYVRPDIVLTAPAGNPIETTVNATKSQIIAGSGPHYFLSGSNKIISSVTAATSNLGCVSATVFEAGTTWQSFYAGSRSQKVFNMTVASNPTATYTIGLYYTSAELAGKTATSLSIAGTTASAMAGVSSSNTTIYTTSVTAYGAGYIFSATVPASGKYFLAENNVTSVFEPRRQDKFVRLLQNPVTSFIPLQVSNPSHEKIAATLFTLNGQVLKQWQQGRIDGRTELPIQGIPLPSGVYILMITTDTKTQSFKLIKL